jgi:hypothetical protein
VAQRPMCFTRAGRKHGEPLTRPLRRSSRVTTAICPGRRRRRSSGRHPTSACSSPTVIVRGLTVGQGMSRGARSDQAGARQGPQRRKGQLRPAPRRDPRQDLGGRRLQRLGPLAQPLRPRANGTRSAAVTLPPGRRFAFRYLAEGGRWHDDETAEAFEPNGPGGHNAVIHTWKQAPSRSPSRLDSFREAQGLGRRSDPEQLPGPCGGHGRPRRLVGWAASCRGPDSWRRTRCRGPGGRSWRTRRASPAGRRPR